MDNTSSKNRTFFKDEFFDEKYVTLVDDTPESVRDGVEIASTRNISPESMREATIRRMAPHRQTLISLVQNIYDEAGNGRCFADEWNDVFSNTFRRWQRHSDTIARLVSGGIGNDSTVRR